jgi:hypothetical protein
MEQEPRNYSLMSGTAILSPTWDDGAPSEELIARLKRDAPEGCLLCQLDDMDGE